MIELLSVDHFRQSDSVSEFAHDGLSEEPET
jgi:hypothetical protein